MMCSAVVRWRVSFKVRGRGGAEWIQVVRDIDRDTAGDAVRHARRLLKRTWPSARARVRLVTRDRVSEARVERES